MTATTPFSQPDASRSVDARLEFLNRVSQPRSGLVCCRIAASTAQQRRTVALGGGHPLELPVVVLPLVLRRDAFDRVPMLGNLPVLDAEQVVEGARFTGEGALADDEHKI